VTTQEVLAAFRNLKALVVGDICLDRWCTYDPATAEPSRETGIPRIGVVATEVTAGGGGTIANNLVALGAGEVAVLGAIGDDGFGWELLRALAAGNISTDLCVMAPHMPTFTYTKLINRHTGVEDLPRLDFIYTQAMPQHVEEDILEYLRDMGPAFDVILVSDQAETDAGGVVTPAVRSMLTELATAHPDKIVWADSRMRPELFRKVIVKPNEQEAAAACRRAFGTVDFARLLRHIESELLLVTHGAKGVLLVTPSGETWFPAKAVETPVDICGAGDSFSAGAALALAVTKDPIEASRIGNLVASVTIMKRGTGTASPDEVLAKEADR
jgi:rfaE bifunctional protein kinase chain/domain